MIINGYFIGQVHGVFQKRCSSLVSKMGRLSFDKRTGSFSWYYNTSFIINIRANVHFYVNIFIYNLYNHCSLEKVTPIVVLQ